MISLKIDEMSFDPETCSEQSGGDLSKNDKVAKLFLSIIKTINQLKDVGDENVASRTVKIQFEDHFYALIASTSTRITVIKNRVQGSLDG